jgi:1-deoxy-D-xylulose-5-phosphate synthase
MLLDVARRHDLLVTLEENALAGGAGSAVQECLLRRHLQVPLLQLGLPDQYIEHGTREESLREAGLDPDSLRIAIGARLEKLLRSRTSAGAAATSTRRAGGAARAAVAQQRLLGD